MMSDPASGTAAQWRLVKPYQPVTIVTALPPNVGLTYSSQSAQLAWTGNGTFYNVYRSTTSGSGYVKIANLTTNLNYNDANLSNGTAYYYVVTAVNILGEESANSPEVVAHPASTTMLPMSFALLNNALQFSWPSDHTGWRLMMNTNNLSDSSAWNPVASSAFTNQIWIPVDMAQTNVFFQLVYP
jgi:hypothetical protein